MTTKSDVALLLASLEQAIRLDRRFFGAAQADTTFGPIESDVKGLLARLLDEAESHAHQELAQAQSAFAELKEWHGETIAINEAMSKLEARFGAGSYFGYLDTPTLARKAKTTAKTVLQAQRASLRKMLDDLTARAGSLRSYVTARLPTCATNPEDQLARLDEAEQQFDEALRLARREEYESWIQALQLLKACIDTLGPLETELASREREIQEEQRQTRAEARYQERVAEARAGRSARLKRLALAASLFVFGSGIAAGIWLFSAWAMRDVVYDAATPLAVILLSVLVLVGLPFLYAVADGTWGNGPGSMSWLWFIPGFFIGGLIISVLLPNTNSWDLAALFAPMVAVSLGAAFEVTIRGTRSINEDFREAIAIARGGGSVKRCVNPVRRRSSC